MKLQLRSTTANFFPSLLKCKNNFVQTLHENTSRMCQASNILYYSPQKGFVQGSTGIKNGKLRITWGCFNAAQNQHRCNGRVLPQNTSWYQDMIYQIRRDTKKHHTRDSSWGAFSAEVHHCLKGKRERRILPACLERPPTPRGLSGDVLDEQVGVDGLVISYLIQGRTGQTLLIWLTWWCGIYFRADLLDGDLLSRVFQ